MVSTLAQASDMLIYAAIAVYAVALVAFSVDLARLADHSSTKSRKPGQIGLTVTWLGFVIHLGGVVLRGVSVGRVPWANMYEFAITATVIAVGVFLLIQIGRDMRFLGAPVMLLVSLALGFAMVLFYTDATQLPPPLQFYWLIIHVSLATTSVGVLTVAFLLSVLQLLVARQRRLDAEAGAAGEVAARTQPVELAMAGVAPAANAPSQISEPLDGVSVANEVASGAARSNGAAKVRGAGAGAGANRGRMANLLSRLPNESVIEGLAFRLNAVGFVLWTFTLVAGAIWAEHTWGRYWAWDAKEVWTFIIWVVYAAYLHARGTRGWSGARAAWFAIAGFACVIFNYAIVNTLFNSIHAYSGIG